jgi:hypothetical protein
MRNLAALTTMTLFLMLSLTLAVSPAFGDTQAATFNNLTGEALANGPFTLGWQFTVNSPITVTKLEAFDSSQDGLFESHDVGIWNSTGSLLVSATIAAGTVDALINQFRVKPVTPTLLAAGTYNIGAVWLDGADPNTFPGDLSNFATAPQITFVDPAYIGGATLADPVNIFSDAPAYFGPNLAYVTPEPSAILLLGISLFVTGGMSFGRHYTKRQK